MTAGAEAGVRIVALQLVDQVARLPDTEFVRSGEPEPVTQQAHEVDFPAAANCPESTNLRSRGGTGAGETGAGCRGAANSWAGANLNDFLWLGVFARVASDPGQFVLHGLVAGGVGPFDHLLEPIEVMKQSGVKFEFEIARGTCRTEIWLADLSVGADVELEHEVELSWVEWGWLCLGIPGVGWVGWLAFAGES